LLLIFCQQFVLANTTLNEKRLPRYLIFWLWQHFFPKSELLVPNFIFKNYCTLSNVKVFVLFSIVLISLTCTSMFYDQFFFISGIKALPITIDVTVIIARVITGLVSRNTSTIAFVGEDWHTLSITFLTDWNAQVIAFPIMFRANSWTRFFALRCPNC
jgi:hypothetical protein